MRASYTPVSPSSIACQGRLRYHAHRLFYSLTRTDKVGPAKFATGPHLVRHSDGRQGTINNLKRYRGPFGPTLHNPFPELVGHHEGQYVPVCLFAHSSTETTAGDDA